MDDLNQLQVARRFANAFAESLAETLTLKLGTPWLVKTLDEADVAKPAEAGVHFRLSAAGGLQGECFVAFEQAQVIALGSKLLEQPGSALSDAQVEALAEVIVSAMEGVSSSLAAQFNRRHP